MAIQQTSYPRRRKRSPRLPWKRGPRAWEIVQRADGILETLNDTRRGFYSLRRTAKLLGISTQPVRDWIRLGQLKRDGPRRQISRTELKRFIYELIRRAEPFDPGNYVDRIEHNRKHPSWPWRKLVMADFTWPKGRDLLTPSELAGLIGCHPSLIIKAIMAGRVSAHRRTPGRWAVTRRSWRRRFF
jgi:hypothetical protein